MIKAIFKEIFIMITLLLAIALIMAILFYEYNPMNKVVPNKVPYTVPDDVQQELKEVTSEQTMINIEGKSYVIDGTDINSYKRTNTYNPNKENPFAVISGSGNTNSITNSTSGGGGSTKGGGNSSSGGSATRIK